MDANRLSDLMHLSIDERIQLVEDLWDSIAADAESKPEALPLSEAQRAEVRRRSQAYRKNPALAFPLEEVLGRIEQSLG
jgi:putative addiction module component (TIGR02574 family)